ncbi:MAG: transglutaminase domain-containing protein, partial [Acidobacteriaceae bacterium]
LESNVIATRNLPPNAQVSEKHGSWELHVTNIPPQLEEEDAPPLHSLGYRVLFFYIGPDLASVDQFWQEAGLEFSAGVDHYAAPDRLKDAVAKIVAPGDTDEQKVRKIYAAVMKLENTRFTRRRTEEEDKADNVQIKDAADVWAQQRGNRQQIALLFLGLVRAAGLKAYAMKVTDRDENVFRKAETDWDQLDDLIAIVPIGGIEMYFDPGERYCEYGMLHWKHTWTEGVRETERGTELAATPPPAAHDTTVTRNADLTLDADGQVHGTIRVAMTGNMALIWRQEALVTDEAQVNKDYGDEVQAAVPSGTTVKMQGFTALTDSTQPLVATLEVSGALGTKTGKRTFLPGSFFEVRAKPRFAAADRVNPVYLPFTYIMRDEVKVKLPPGLSTEIKPQDAVIPMGQDGEYTASYRISGAVYQFSRLEMVSRMLYPVKDYPALRDFYQKMNTQDQTQVVLAAAPAAAAAPSKQ